MLNKKWKELLFAFSAFGPNILMVMMTAYFTNAVDTRLLDENIELLSFSSMVIVIPMLFGALWMVARIFDGFIDIPLAAVTNRMKSKYSRLKLPILIGFIPMVASFILNWIPIFPNGAESLANTLWFFGINIIFASAYTFVLIAFYGSIASISTSQAQRTRISAFKSIFDTIAYSLVYALVPFILEWMNISIDKFVLMSTPLMLTIFIPFLLFRKSAVSVDTKQDIAEESVERPGLWMSIKTVIKNKIFLTWLGVNCLSFFGLQLFLVSQPALISGVLKLDSMLYQMLLNSAAFAPIPLMMLLFYFLLKKKGVRFVVQVAMLVFAVAILGFFFGSAYFFPDSIMPRVVIACIGGTLASFSIGVFFALPVMIPSQLGAVEMKLTKKNNSAMYFAVQAFATTLAAAISTGLVYAAIKGIPLLHDVYGNQVLLETLEDGTKVFLDYKLGGMLVPIIVSVVCIGAFALSFLMPKKIDEKSIAPYYGVDPDKVDEEQSLADSIAAEGAEA